MKQFKVFYRSRYHPLEGERVKVVQATKGAEIRRDWHSIIETDEYRITRIEEIEGAGLRIRTVTGDEFDVHGPVTHRDFDEDGRIYYCDGRSFSEEIVTAVI